MIFNKLARLTALTVSVVVISACSSTPASDDFDLRKGGSTHYPSSNSKPQPTSHTPWTQKKQTGDETSINSKWEDANSKVFTALPAEQQIFKPIYFARNSYTIGTAEAGSLETLVQFLKSHSSLYLTIEGHCSIRGSEEFNMSLGEKRAQAVRQFLENRSIAVHRLNTVSYGEERPAKAGNDESAHAANRRCVLVLGHKN